MRTWIRFSSLLTLLLLLPVSSSVSLPAAHAQAAGSIPASPSLNTITLTDYAGNDQAGVADLAAGKIAAYDFGLTPTEVQQLPPGFDLYQTPSAWYGLQINPTNTSSGFNPFMFQQVRLALNYVVGRDYFVNNLLGGDGIQAISVYGGEPDQLVTSAATAPFSNFTSSLSDANATIFKTLTSHGATFKSTATPQWSYEGKPVTVSIFDRTDDPIRSAYAGFLGSQLKDLGFAVTMVSGSLEKAESVYFGTDPVNATWDIYPQSYSGVYGYYDEGLAELYAPIFGSLPASSTTGLSWGTYNDTKYELPDTIALLDQCDKYGNELSNSNFTTIQQRDEELGNLTYYGVLASVNIGIATSLAPYAVSSHLQGVTTNFQADPLLNTVSYLTMKTSSGSVEIGLRHLSQSSLNPVLGFSDSYSQSWASATYFEYEFDQASTGYPYPIGWTYQMKADDPKTDVAVPSGALVFNATADSFGPAPAGTFAKTDVVANFAQTLREKWADGQPVTLADLVYQYVLAEEIALNPRSSAYDSSANSAFAPELASVVAFRLLNATSFEVYSDSFYPDSLFDAENAVGSFIAFPAPQALTPWQMYAGIASVVSSGKAAWSTAAATEKNVDWFSEVNPADLANLKAALSTYAGTGYVPPELLQLQSISGIRLVSQQNATAGFTAAVDFINQYGNGVIGNGPYILSQYSPSTSPAFLVLTKNPAFDWGNIASPQLAAPAVILSQQAIVPPLFSPGQNLTVDALQTPEGTTQASPAPGATVTVQLVADGKIAYRGSFTTNSAGQAAVHIPSSVAPGTYDVVIYTSSPTSTLLNPLTQTITLTPAGTTTPTPTASPTAVPTSSASAVAPSSSGTPITYLAAAVVLVVIVVAVAFALRRR
jgi:peptide/nickel transport system substrate-binding protein